MVVLALPALASIAIPKLPVRPISIPIVIHPLS